MLDLKEAMKRFRNKIRKVIESQQIEPIQINITEQLISNLAKEMEKNIFLASQNQEYRSLSKEKQKYVNDSIQDKSNGNSN